MLPIVLLAYPIDVLLSYWYKKSHRYPGEMEVWNAIYDGSAQCDLAIYGSSRAWVHFDPKILSDSLNCGVYNFGMDGQNFVLQYLRHKEFIKFNPYPKHIVLSLDVFSLSIKGGIYEMKQFLPYVLWNPSLAKGTVNNQGLTWSDAIIPLVRYAGQTKVFNQIKMNIVNDESTPAYRKRGFRGMRRNWSNDFDLAKQQKQTLQLAVDPVILNQLEGFIQECQKAGTSLTFVYCPEHILGQGFLTNRQQIFETFQTVAKRNNIDFLDYSNMDICNDTNYFYSASHLNKDGAMIFSKQLAHDLKTRWQQ